MNFMILSIYFVLSIFSNGNWIFPILAWIAPVFLVGYLRKQRPLLGLVSAFIAFYISEAIQWNSMIPLDGPIYFLVILGIALTFYSPFIINRFLYGKVNGFYSTFILPLSAVIVEFIYMNTNPFGDWGITALTQLNNLYFIQITSITGAMGITFMIYWFVSVINWVWENGFQINKIKRGVIIFSASIAVIMVYGFILVEFYPPDSKTVRIASVSPETKVELKYSDPEMMIINDKIDNRITLNNEELEHYKIFHAKYLEELLKFSEKEALAGTKIIVWPECGAWLLREDREKFLDKCRKLAGIYNIFLLTSVFLVDTNAEIPYIDLVNFFQPDGTVQEYIKTKIVPGDYMQKGDGKIFITETPYGKISSLICFDLDFTSYVSRVKDADILLVPSNDWKAIDPYHTEMIKLKAIEFGFNIVRHPTKGLAAAYNYRGNGLGFSDYFIDNPQIMVANVPVKGIITIYSILGEWFVYLCFISFAVLILLIIFGRKLPTAGRR